MRLRRLSSVARVNIGILTLTVAAELVLVAAWGFGAMSRVDSLRDAGQVLLTVLMFVLLLIGPVACLVVTTVWADHRDKVALAFAFAGSAVNNVFAFRYVIEVATSDRVMAILALLVSAMVQMLIGFATFLVVSLAILGSRLARPRTDEASEERPSELWRSRLGLVRPPASTMTGEHGGSSNDQVANPTDSTSRTHTVR